MENQQYLQYIEELLRGDRTHEKAFADACKALCYAQIYSRNYQLAENHNAAVEWTMEDFFHETFLVVWDKLSCYDPKKGAFSTWYARICSNIYMNKYKKSKRFSYTDLTVLESDQNFVFDGAETAFLKRERESWHMFEQELDHINPKYARAIELHYMRGFSVKEVALLMEVNESTVNNWLARGRSKLESFCKKQQLKEGLYFEMAA